MKLPLFSQQHSSIESIQRPVVVEDPFAVVEEDDFFVKIKIKIARIMRLQRMKTRVCVCCESEKCESGKCGKIYT